MSKLSMALISIIIPVYKAEEYLHRCLESVLRQSYENIEIILVNDGSPDRSGVICDEYAKKDRRVRVIHQENKGQAAARNRGLDIAAGDYIGFVDADDYIDQRMYEKLRYLLTDHEAQIACCGTNLVDMQGEVVSTYTLPTSDFIIYNRQDALLEHLNNDRITSSLCDKLFCTEVFYHTRMVEVIVSSLLYTGITTDIPLI